MPARTHLLPQTFPCTAPYREGGAPHVALVATPSTKLRLPHLNSLDDLANSPLMGLVVPGARPQVELGGRTITLPQIDPQDLGVRRHWDRRFREWRNVIPRAYSQDGQEIGYYLRVPAIYCRVNRALSAQQRGIPYNYERLLGDLRGDAVEHASSILRRAALKPRLPGFMATARAIPALEHDQTAISRELAEEVIRRKIFGEISLEDLQGMPTWTVRFPKANRHCPMLSRLRVLRGGGLYCGVNPSTLGERLLGDEDGDTLGVARRTLDVESSQEDLVADFQGFFVDELNQGLRQQILGQEDDLDLQFPEEAQGGGVTLSAMLDPVGSLGIPEDQRGRWEGHYGGEAASAALATMHRRNDVAHYTTLFGWYAARALVLLGYSPREAYDVAYGDFLEPLMEASMDAKATKGSSQSDAQSAIQFLQSILQGFLPETSELVRRGLSEEAAEKLHWLWWKADGNLREFCQQDPIYRGIVLGRGQIPQHLPALLQTVEDQHPSAKLERIILSLDLK